MFPRNFPQLLAFIVLISACSSSDQATTQNLSPVEPGHHIKVKIDGYDQDILTLANYYGEKQYEKATLFNLSMKSVNISDHLYAACL